MKELAAALLLVGSTTTPNTTPATGTPRATSSIQQRAYHTSTIDVVPDCDDCFSLSWSSGILWSAPPRGARVFRFDSSGARLTTSLEPLASQNAPIKAIWPVGAGIYVLVGGKILSVTRDDQVELVSDIAPDLWDIAPVKDGYVGRSRFKLSDWFYVHSDGTRSPFHWEPSVPADHGKTGQEVSASATGICAHGNKTAPPAPSEVHPQNDAIVAIGDNRVARVSIVPYRLQIAGLDGMVSCTDIDDSHAVSPEESSLLKRDDAQLLGVAPAGIEKLLVHEGRLTIDRVYQATFQNLTSTGLPAGTRFVKFFHMLDIVDPANGSLVERIDLPAVQRASRFAGYRGTSLVLASFGMPSGKGTITFASAE